MRSGQAEQGLATLARWRLQLADAQRKQIVQIRAPTRPVQVSDWDDDGRSNSALARSRRPDNDIAAELDQHAWFDTSGAWAQWRRWQQGAVIALVRTHRAAQ